MADRAVRGRPARIPRVIALIGVLFVAALLLSACTSPPRSLEAVWLLQDLAADASPTRLERRHPEVERRDHRLPATTTAPETVADSYRSDNQRRGVLVLVHGFSEEGRRDPRLVEFAHTLARSGFLVFVPELPGLRDLSVSTREIAALQAGFAYALETFPAARDQAIGGMALSLAVGPLLLAAKDAALREEIHFLVGVGGYHALPDALRFITTGVDIVDGESVATRTPAESGRWLVLASQSHWVEDSDQQALLAEIAERRIEDGRADVGDLLDRLDADGKAMFALTDNRDPDAVDSLLDDLPADALAELHALDLARRDLSALDAAVVLIHGRDDRVIPISHSRRLSARLAENNRSVWLYETGALGHVDVQPGLIEGFALWRATRRILLLGEG